MNAHIVDELMSTADYYNSIGDEGRKTAYERAAASVEAYPKEITSAAEAKTLRWIGDGIAAKIDDILKKHHSMDSDHNSNSKYKNNNIKKDIIKKEINKKDNNKKDNRNTSLNEDAFVVSLEHVKKSKLLSNGPSFVQTTLQSNKHLNRQVRTLRVKQYEYMEKPKEEAAVISRNELSFFVTCVKTTWEKIIHRLNPKHNATIECCGSYRRNAPTCHECVILLKSDIVFARLKEPFQQLINTLSKIHLLHSNEITKENKTMEYRGIVDLSILFIDSRTKEPPAKPTHLPVILKVIEPEAWPCSLLYWTGPNMYWVKLQSAAQRAGYDLTPDGLFVRVGRKRLRHRDEYDVIMDIGVEYQEPLFR